MNKALLILRKNRKSIETLIPNFGNSLKYIFPFSEFGKIGNLKGSPVGHIMTYVNFLLAPWPCPVVSRSYKIHIWTRFRVTGPKSRGPGPITRARSHKNDFYGTGLIKMLNSRDRSHISKIGHISRLWEGWNWLILCDSDYLLCYGLLQTFFYQFVFIKAKKS